MTGEDGWKRSATFTVACPGCKTVARYDMAVIGEDTVCGRCGRQFPAVPDLANGDEISVGISVPAETIEASRRRDEPDEDDSFDAPRRRGPSDDGSGLAVAALVLGVFNLAFWCCPPVGVLSGAAGLALGFAGLASRSRTAALTGMVLSLVGLLLSVGFGVLVGVIMVQEEELKADPSGNRPPFFHAPN